MVALAGAGLTLALKDFIVGFFGWFVLMGRTGFAPAIGSKSTAWAEKFWKSDYSRPSCSKPGTGQTLHIRRAEKLTFVNSFAIEGHYVNFRPRAEWLWDEFEVQVPRNADPYPLAEAIQKIVTDDTANSHEAETDWQGNEYLHTKQTFSYDTVCKCTAYRRRREQSWCATSRARASRQRFARGFFPGGNRIVAAEESSGGYASLGGDSNPANSEREASAPASYLEKHEKVMSVPEQQTNKELPQSTSLGKCIPRMILRSGDHNLRL